MDKNELFENNLKLVYHLYHKIMSTSTQWFRRNYGDDVMQAGLHGLWKACTKYDGDSGNKFSTFAVPTIHGTMLKYIEQTLRNRRKTNLDESSLNEPIAIDGDNELTLGDTIAAEIPDNPEHVYIDNRLDERQQRICKLLAEGNSQREIGEQIGCTQVQVSRIIKKIRNILSEDYDAIL